MKYLIHLLKIINIMSKKDERRHEIFESKKDIDYNTLVLNCNDKKSGKLLIILLMQLIFMK